MYMRFKCPPAQRSPSPIWIVACVASPWNTMLSALESSPEQLNCSVSAARLAEPEADSSAPPVAAEFWQPRPSVPLLPQGQATLEPSPKQNAAAPNDIGVTRMSSARKITP